MKQLFLLSALILTGTSQAVNAAAGACANQRYSKVTQSCRATLAQAIAHDKDAKALRRTLENTYPLSKCQALSPRELKVDYVADEAVGPTLAVSAAYACESNDDADGYVITGDYYLEGEGFRFRQLTLTTAE